VALVGKMPTIDVRRLDLLVETLEWVGAAEGAPTQSDSDENAVFHAPDRVARPSARPNGERDTGKKAPCCRGWRGPSSEK
jgi:hypothetical protein